MRAAWWHPYWAVVSARFRVLLQYRAAAIAGIVTQLFWAMLRISVLVAFAAQTTVASPMTIAQMATYVWLGQAFFRALPWDADPELAQQIRSGAVGYEMLRPLNLYWFWFARTLSYRAAPTALRMLPVALTAGVVLPIIGLGEFGLAAPAGAISGGLFVVAVIGLLLLSTAITALMQVSLLWTISGEGLNRMMPAVATALSGMLIPLPLFPEWTQWFIRWQPFRGVGDVPFRIYSGNIAPLDAIGEIALQLGWTALLTMLGVALLRRGLRRLVVQGG